MWGACAGAVLEHPQGLAWPLTARQSCATIVCMGSERVHLVVAAEERAAYLAAAERENLTLSEWLRRAARARIDGARVQLLSPVDLDAFFEACDAAAGDEVEPDWDSHLATMRASRSDGSMS